MSYCSNVIIQGKIIINEPYSLLIHTSYFISRSLYAQFTSVVIILLFESSTGDVSNF